MNKWKASQSPLIYGNVVTILDMFRSDGENTQKISEEVRIDGNGTHYAMRYCFCIKLPIKNRDEILSSMNKKGWIIGLEDILCRDIHCDKESIEKEPGAIFDVIYQKIEECVCYRKTYNKLYKDYFLDSTKTGETSAEDFILQLCKEYEEARKEIFFESLKNIKSLKTKLELDGFYAIS